MRVLACSLLLLLATGCAIVPLDQYYGYGRGGYSHHYDRDHYDGDRYHRDHRDDDDRRYR